jgi:hypothetical protein
MRDRRSRLRQKRKPPSASRRPRARRRQGSPSHRLKQPRPNELFRSRFGLPVYSPVFTRPGSIRLAGDPCYDPAPAATRFGVRDNGRRDHQIRVRPVFGCRGGGPGCSGAWYPDLPQVRAKRQSRKRCKRNFRLRSGPTAEGLQFNDVRRFGRQFEPSRQDTCGRRANLSIRAS